MSHKKLVCLAIGDPHFKINNTSHSQEFVDKSLEFIDQNPIIDIIVVLGDVHDKHQVAHTVISTAVSEYFRQLQARKPLFIVVGNHDRPNNQDHLSSIHSFNDMKSWSNTYVVDQVLDVTINDFRLVFVPYVYPGRFNEALNTIDDPLHKTAMIFAHQEFEGVKMGHIKSVKGDKWHKGFPWIVTGHIHDYWFNGQNIIYTGTPMQHAFGDSADKTISVYVISDNSKKLDDYTGCNVIKVEDDLKTKLVNNLPNPEQIQIRCQWDYFFPRYNKGNKVDLNNDTHFYLPVNITDNTEISFYDVKETRIDLKLIKRRIKRIAVEKILAFVPDPNYLEKVIIVGTFGKCQAVKDMDYIKELEKKVVKVDYSYIEDETIISEALDDKPSSQTSYLADLYQAVSDDERKVRLLQDIFRELN